MTGSEYMLGYNYGRVLNNALWQSSGYVRSTFHRALNKPPVLNMPGLRIWQDCEWARVTKGAEYAWISLNNVSGWVEML